MRNRVSNWLWGLFWISLGVIIAGNAFHWWDVTLFFPGWWTLFIIVPCGISMISHGFGNFSSIGLAVGILLLLNCQGIIIDERFRKLLVPMILILIGICMVFRNIINDTRKVSVTYGKEDCHAATFAGNTFVHPNTQFKGSELDAIFGSMTLDLRSAIIDENVVIHATAIFGGIDIYIPSNVKVMVSSSSFFGGVSHKYRRSAMEGSPIIYLNVTCMFGGVELK